MRTLCEVSSILEPMASLAAVARVPRDASESLATSVFRVSLAWLLRREGGMMRRRTLVAPLLGLGTGTLDALGHVVDGVPVDTC